MAAQAVTFGSMPLMWNDKKLLTTIVFTNNDDAGKSLTTV